MENPLKKKELKLRKNGDENFQHFFPKNSYGLQNLIIKTSFLCDSEDITFLEFFIWKLNTKALFSVTIKFRMSSRKTSPDIDVFYENQLESNDTLMIFATARKIYDCFIKQNLAKYYLQ